MANFMFLIVQALSATVVYAPRGDIAGVQQYVVERVLFIFPEIPLQAFASSLAQSVQEAMKKTTIVGQCGIHSRTFLNCKYAPDKTDSELELRENLLI